MKESSEINQNYLIIGPNIDYNAYQDTSEYFNIHGDGKKTVEIGNISIEEGSRVVINAHGCNSDSKHQIALYSSMGYESGIDYTHCNFEKLPQCHVELFSCYGGNAICNITSLPENSTLITFVDGKYPMWTDIAEELIKMSVNFSQPEDPFTRFACFLATNADDTRFAINIEEGEKLFSSKVSELKDFSNEGIRAWQKTRILEFVNFIDEAKNHSNDSNKEKIEQFIELVKDEDHLNQFINKFDVNLYRTMLVMNFIMQGKIESIESCLNHVEVINDFASMAFYVRNKEALELILKTNKINLQNTFGQTLLLTAAEEGHIEIVNLLLEKGVKIDQADESGHTPLFIAVFKENLKMIELLLEKGAEIDQENESFNTPLLIAASKGNLKLVELLLEKGSTIDQANDLGQTPLFLATQAGHMQVVKLLLKHKADINLPNILDETPLLIAVQQGDERIVELLLENSAKNGSAREAAINQIDSQGKNLLDIAIENSQYSIAKLLIKAGIKHKEVDGYNLDFITNMLRSAIKDNDEEIVESLLTHPSLQDATKEGGALVLYAREMKKPEVTNYMIKHGFQQKTLAQGTKRKAFSDLTKAPTNLKNREIGVKRKASIDPEEDRPRISPEDALEKFENFTIFNNDQKPSNKKPRGGAKQTASSLVR